MKNKKHPYEDILTRPRPVFPDRAPMPLADRAAQFSPFAALTGYDAAILGAARLTRERKELGEDERQELDRRLRLWRQAPDSPAILCYFQRDERKSGGDYISREVRLKRYEETDRTLLLRDGTRVAVEDVIALEGELFDRWPP